MQTACTCGNSRGTFNVKPLLPSYPQSCYGHGNSACFLPFLFLSTLYNTIQDELPKACRKRSSSQILGSVYRAPAVRDGRGANLLFPAQADASEAQPLRAPILMHALMLYLPHCCYTQRLFLGESLRDLDTILWFLQGR